MTRLEMCIWWSRTVSDTLLLICQMNKSAVMQQRLSLWAFIQTRLSVWSNQWGWFTLMWCLKNKGWHFFDRHDDETLMVMDTYVSCVAQFKSYFNMHSVTFLSNIRCALHFYLLQTSEPFWGEISLQQFSSQWSPPGKTSQLSDRK